MLFPLEVSMMFNRTTLRTILMRLPCSVAEGIVVLLGTALLMPSRTNHPHSSRKPMAKQHKWYVVWAGHEPGVYETWAECQRQIQTYPKALFKAFESRS